MSRSELDRTVTRTRPLLAGLFAAGVVGCGGAGGPELHPVRGTLTVNGSPAEGAGVVLRPVAPRADLNNPTGTVAADGSFKLFTYPHGDGAPAGEYVVLLSWQVPNPKDPDNPKHKLPLKYADAEKTPLPKVTVKPGPNDLAPFVVTTK